MTYRARRAVRGARRSSNSLAHIFRMTVADVFFIRGRGLVATGTIEDGAVRVGDIVRINDAPATVDGIEAFRKVLDQAQAGDNVGLLFRKLDRGDVQAGDVITAESEARPSWAP